MQSGVIDALEWVGPWNDMSLGFHRIAKYYYGPAFHEGNTNLEFMMNKAKYEALPKDLQMIIKNACTTENMLMHAEFQANNMRALADLQKVKTLTIAPYPDDVLQAFFQMSDEVRAGTASIDAMGKKIYDSFEQYRTTAMDLSRVAESPFVRGREAARKK